MADLFDGNPAKPPQESSENVNESVSSDTKQDDKKGKDNDKQNDQVQSGTNGEDITEDKGFFDDPGSGTSSSEGFSTKKIAKNVAKIGVALHFSSLLLPILVIGSVVGVVAAPVVASQSSKVAVFDDECSLDEKKNSNAIIGGSDAVGDEDWTKKGTKQYETAKRIFDRLTKELGMSGAGASGVLGNLAQETRFNPNVTNQSDGGYGIAQWTFGRKTKLFDWCKSNGKDPADLDAQIDFLMYEMKDKSMWYGVHWKDGNSLQIVGMLSDPKEAAARFYLSMLEAGGGNDVDPDGSQPNREAFAQKAYELFDGGSIKGDETLLGAAADGATSGSAASKASNEKDCSDEEDIDASSLLKAAKSMLKWFTYQQVHNESAVGSFDNPDKNGMTDCSGFVWLALYKAGYKVPAGMGWFTGSMEADAKGKHQWLKEIKPSQAKAGDIVIVNTGGGAGSDGHTAILLESWKDKEPETTNSTKVIQMGGTGEDGVNIHKFGESFLSLVDGSKGAHTITFARPIKK